jgi:hypothetical protein
MSSTRGDNNSTVCLQEPCANRIAGRRSVIKNRCLLIGYRHRQRLIFDHLALGAAAILFLTAALVVGFFGVVPLAVAASASVRSSLLRLSIFSFIAAACLNCCGVSSVMFMKVTTTPEQIKSTVTAVDALSHSAELYDMHFYKAKITPQRKVPPDNSTPITWVLLDHLIRSQQHIRWNSDSYLLGGF